MPWLWGMSPQLPPFGLAADAACRLGTYEVLRDEKWEDSGSLLRARRIAPLVVLFDKKDVRLPETE